jgi:hypothetical protein
MISSRSFFLRPGEGEQIAATVRLADDPRAALIGTVLSADGKPVEGAFVTLWRSGGAEAVDVPEQAAFTDALGRFTLAPLTAGALYQVQVTLSEAGDRTVEEPPRQTV